MKNLLIRAVIGFMIAIALPALSSEREDYAGLPLDDYAVDPGLREVVVDEQQEGYDGLPVMQKTGPEVHFAEIAHHEGYDGLPLFGPVRSDALAVQE